MFTLVTDVARYPEFLPWIRKVRIASQSEEAIVAEFRVGFGPMRVAFTARAILRPPEEVELRLVEGLFSTFHGRWRFEAEEGSATRVTFHLDFELASGRMARFLRPLLQREAVALVRTFKRRAEDRYGPPPGAA
jgi:ribosome-associated toxin RatA of RatAB toxin-antitoxin module